MRSGTTSREGQHNVGARANNRERERHSVITQRGTVVVVAPAALGGGVPVVGGIAVGAHLFIANGLLVLRRGDGASGRGRGWRTGAHAA